MEKKKIITIALIGLIVCMLVFGGVTLSNKTNGSTNKGNKTENSENTEILNKNDTESEKESETQNEQIQTPGDSLNTEDANTEEDSTSIEDKNTEDVTESQTPGTETENKPDAPPASEIPQETPEPPVEEKPKYTFANLNKTMYASSDVNVRDLPSTDGSKVGGLSKGQAVTVTGQCNETKWYRISLNGSVAYVSNNYLTDTKPQEETPSTPSQPSQPSEPSTPSQPSQPSQPSNSNKDDLGNTIDRNKVDMVYTNASIGDGLDEYRNGLHMWTADGKYPLYVHMEWNGKIGYFQLVEDDMMNIIPFSIAYKELPYMNGFSAMSSTDYEPYLFMINGKYYHYQFMYMY